MTKSLLFALFLSQAPIQDVPVFRDQPTLVEYLNADLRLPARRVHTIHVRMSGDGGVGTEETFTKTYPPIPYIDFWRCPLGQTAVQCIAIESVIQQELPGKSMLELKPFFPDPLGK